MSKTSGFFLRGFTLVELIIVVAIIGIMAGGIMVFLDPSAQIQKSRDARRKSDLSEIQKALEVYYQDNNGYPIVTGGSYALGDGGWGTPWLPYMGTVPKDPSSLRNYVYYSTGQSYYLYASLERGSKDPQACNSGNACASATANGVAVACGGNCNYGVSTPDVSL
jgi:prepilin-type N-terminal cleavage/methylation domain-containing protein